MNQPLGKNSLANMMKTISKQAALSREFTNHSIRATSITILDVNKFSDRDIMSVSGHRSESSIKNYTGKVTSTRKYEMSTALCKSVMNDQNVHVELRLSQEQIERRVEGHLNLSQEQINELMEPMPMESEDTNMTNIEQENMPPAVLPIDVHSKTTVSVDVHEETDNATVASIPATSLPSINDIMPEALDSVLKPMENMPFQPIISNCVVTFNVNLNSK